jgi:hypothetical protein
MHWHRSAIGDSPADEGTLRDPRRRPWCVGLWQPCRRCAGSDCPPPAPAARSSRRKHPPAPPGSNREPVDAPGCARPTPRGRIMTPTFEHAAMAATIPTLAHRSNGPAAGQGTRHGLRRDPGSLTCSPSLWLAMLVACRRSTQRSRSRIRLRTLIATDSSNGSGQRWRWVGSRSVQTHHGDSRYRQRREAVAHSFVDARRLAWPTRPCPWFHVGFDSDARSRDSRIRADITKATRQTGRRGVRGPATESDAGRTAHCQRRVYATGDQADQVFLQDLQTAA